jgi:hypothetical protein
MSSVLCYDAQLLSNRLYSSVCDESHKVVINNMLLIVYKKDITQVLITSFTGLGYNTETHYVSLGSLYYIVTGKTGIILTYNSF